ncbi:hypothetical protein [Gluconacetobacter takamatsuzukensis]|uniref:Uncharacterized protein n=1 Tax=Gluconacetobacter takamatsuzukensis TaxID=1286190 RepID=A0A7W4KGH5_9PROT|nr:hypothetical protein [Gluconacetobacter takamatsuzukensis]MBB2206511.1 hypothetical protein [Gluconacetobacter takamatsuzukensis]
MKTSEGKMITDTCPDAGEIAEVGEGFLDGTFPSDRYHHREHLIMMVYLLVKYPTRDWRADLPDLIRRYNVAAGGVNDETRGYHHTITMAFVAIVEAIVFRGERGDCVASCRAVLASPAARQDVLLRFWSRELLFSKEARQDWVAPDLRAFDVDAVAASATM